MPHRVGVAGMSVRVGVVTLIDSCMRTRGITAWCAAMLLLCGCAPSQRGPVTVFEEDVTVDGTHDSASTRSLQAAAYLVEVRERDIDLQVVVDGPGVHYKVEDKVPRHGVLHVVVSLSAPGELNLALRSVDHRSKSGSAHVRIARWQRGAAAAPDDLELGFMALAAAGELTAANSA